MSDFPKQILYFRYSPEQGEHLWQEGTKEFAVRIEGDVIGPVVYTNKDLLEFEEPVEFNKEIRQITDKLLQEVAQGENGAAVVAKKFISQGFNLGDNANLTQIKSEDAAAALQQYAGVYLK
jgi:hypothetical protein